MYMYVCMYVYMCVSVASIYQTPEPAPDLNPNPHPGKPPRCSTNPIWTPNLCTVEQSFLRVLGR